MLGVEGMQERFRQGMEHVLYIVLVHTRIILVLYNNTCRIDNGTVSVTIEQSTFLCFSVDLQLTDNTCIKTPPQLLHSA